jgi:hypothetical protein
MNTAGNILCLLLREESEASLNMLQYTALAWQSNMHKISPSLFAQGKKRKLNFPKSML